jgi:hypothetical protein
MINTIKEQQNLVKQLQEKATSLDSEKKISTVTELETWKTAQKNADEEQKKLSQMQTEATLLK